MVKRKTQNNPNCLDLKNCKECSRKILFWTIVGNIFLTVIKFIGAGISGSSGLFADGLQSVTCVIASIVLMYSLIISQKKHDDKFPYGYGKLEFIVALVVFSVLVGLGFFIAISSIVLITKRDTAAPGIIGLPFAVISAFLTYMMYRYNVCAGRKLDSAAMVANGYQARADTYSSTAVTIGILLSQINPSFGIFDKIAALIVGCLILKDAFEHWFINLKVIIDEVPEKNYQVKVESIISEIFNGPKPQTMKIKRTGNKYWIGIGLNFPETQSIEQMESTTTKIKDLLRKRLSWVGDVDFILDNALPCLPCGGKPV